MPLCIIVAVLLAFNGTPASYDGKDTITTLQGDTVQVSRGPAAGMIAIKHLGTNGGGWFGANSAHPLENPNYFTNMLELVVQVIIPIAMIFALGFYINRKKLAKVIFGVMTIGMLLLLIPTIISEMNGNPAIAKLGISSGYRCNGRKGSTVWSGSFRLLEYCYYHYFHRFSQFHARQFDAFVRYDANAGYDDQCILWRMWCGDSELSYIYIIIAVFIAGLMVGRTPEFMGHKVEAREVKIAALVTLLSAFLIKGWYCIGSLYGGPSSGNIAWAGKTSCLVKQSWLIMVFLKCCTNSLLPMPIMEAGLKDWVIIIFSGM